MLLALLSLITALTISAVAIYYSVVGLTAIFAAAALPIAIMGSTLEVAKLVATVWLHKNWNDAPKLMKTYLVSAVLILMLITSMGIFGFLSKAHLDQSVPSGDVAAKVSLLDEKIQTQKDNITTARQALKQMDEAVDQTMARSGDDKGADKAVAIRRSQAKERARLQNDISSAQTEITKLQEVRAPIASELRKVEAEVGPIKYIAAFVYGATDESILEKAVTWVILIIIVVFDPLAVMLLLASQFSFNQIRRVALVPEPIVEDKKEEVKTDSEEIAKSYTAPIDYKVEDADEEESSILDAHPYLNSEKSFWHKPEGWVSVPPQVYTPEVKDEPMVLEMPGTMGTAKIVQPEESDPDLEAWNKMIEEAEKAVIEESTDTVNIEWTDEVARWKEANPDKDIFEEQRKFNQGLIDKLPWESKYKIIPELLDRPGDYLKRPEYVQNEEQADSTLWSKASKVISQQDYQTKVEEEREAELLVAKIDSGEIKVTDLDEHQAAIVERYLGRNNEQ